MNKKLFLFLVSLKAFIAFGQNGNYPDNSTSVPGAAGAGQIALPTPYNQAPNTVTNTLLNYTRELAPLTPQQGNIDESTPNTNMSTTYLSGTGQPYQKVIRNFESNTDRIFPFDGRADVTTYSFPPYSAPTNGGKIHLNPFTEQQSYYLNKFPNEGTTAYQQTTYSSADQYRQSSIYQPGISNVGNGHGVVIQNLYNAAGEVINWTVDENGDLVNSGYYAAATLSKKETTAFDSLYTEEFTDMDGKLILKTSYYSTPVSQPTNPGSPNPSPQFQAYQTNNGSVPTQSNTRLCTYYVYNNIGQLAYMIPPKAYEKIIAGSNLSTVITNLCYTYKYDALGNVTERGVPGTTGITATVYDNLNRPVMTQTPLMAQTGQWLCSVYDWQGRVVATAIYMDGNNLSRDAWQSIISNTNPPDNYFGEVIYYLLYPVADANTFIDLVSNMTYSANSVYQKISFYDKYDDFGDYFEASQYIGNTVSTSISETPTHVTNIYGKTAATLYLIDDGTNSNYGFDAFSYDIKGRLLQINTFINNKSIYTSYQYDFNNKVLREIITVNNPDADKQTTQMVLNNIYDGINQLIQTSLNIDNEGWVTQSAYAYNDDGTVWRKFIGSEKQLYSYNIRGQLTGINADYAESQAIYPATTFGESIKYDYGFSQPLADGKIAGIIWRSSPNSRNRAYGYSYDRLGRLVQADYNEYSQSVPDVPASQWNNLTGDYSVNNISYDANGNLLSMNQKSVTTDAYGQPQIVDMDKLTYVYQNNDISNKLDRVEDGVTQDYHLGDFINNNAGTTDYNYDASGNLTQDLNKGLTSADYNYLNKPLGVHSVVAVQGVGNESIWANYTYDANGNKISKTGGGDVDYVGPFVFQNNAISYLLTSEGRAIYHKNEYGNLVWDYDFFITDHLGNVRDIISREQYDPTIYLATHEVAMANTEHLTFAREDSVRAPKPGGDGPDDASAARLNGSDPQHAIGTTLLLHVMEGDKIDLNTDYYFARGFDATNDNPTPDDQMLNNILSTLSNATYGNMGEGSAQNIIHGLFQPNNYLSGYVNLVSQSIDSTKPQAFLNYLVYDEKMNLIPEQSGVMQVENPDDWQNISLSDQLTFAQNGYVAIYISNKSNYDVWFDNIHVNFYKSQLVEQDDYYPFGLAINEGSSDDISIKYLYQGKELIKDNNLMWQDFHARIYDPQLGRFNNVDPANQFASGYIGMGNNPVSGTDPTGAYDGWDDLAMGVIGGITNLVTNWSTIGSIGEGIDYLFAGAEAGFMTEYSGPAAGAFLGVENLAIRSAYHNINVKPIDYLESAGIGALSSVAGQAVANEVNPMVGNLLQPLKNYPVPYNFALGSITGGLTGAGIGFGSSLLQGGNLEQALSAGGNGAELGFATGGMTGAAIGFQAARTMNKNAFTGENYNPAITPMQPRGMVDVYRVYGGDAKENGWSFTPIDPRSMPEVKFRDVAGLPSGKQSGRTNTAQFMIHGTVEINNILEIRPASYLDMNVGGLPEFIIDPVNVKILSWHVLK